MRQKWQFVLLVVMCIGLLRAAFAAGPTITSISPAAGPVNSTVTIKGTGLGATGGSVTFFNGQNEHATSWSESNMGTTTIVVSVPPGATSGGVYVTTAGGVNSNSLPFTVTPSINTSGGLSPSSGPVGQSVTITGNNFGSSGTVTFNGIQAETSSYSPSSITAIAPIGATTGNVVVTVGGYPSNGVSFTVQAGNPLIYAARTDACVVNGQSNPGCTGAATGQSGSALSFLGQTGDPMPWYQTGCTPGLACTIDPVGTAITDPDFNSYQVMATSGAQALQLFGSATQSVNVSANVSSTTRVYKVDADVPVFSQDDSLFLVSNAGGNWAVLAVNVAAIHAKTCSTTLCVGWSGITAGRSNSSGTYSDNCNEIGGTSCSVLNSQGSFIFSGKQGETLVIYELMGSSYQTGLTATRVGTQVNKLSLTCSGTWGQSSNPTCTFTRTPYVNFTQDYADSPNDTVKVPCSVLPPSYSSNAPWTGLFRVANDGTVGYTLGGAGNWQANTSYQYPGSFIYPQNNNSLQCAFQATTSGVSGSAGSEPTFSSGSGSCDVGATVQDNGTLTWTNIGKIGGQGPGFDIVYYNPARGCRHLNTRIATVYNGTNEGGCYPNSSCSPDQTGALQTDQVAALFNICMLQYDTDGEITQTITQSELSGCQQANLQNPVPGPLTDQTTIHDGGVTKNSTYVAWTPTGGGSKTYQNGVAQFGAGTQSCRGSGTNYPEISCYHIVWQAIDSPGATAPIARPLQLWVDYQGSNWGYCPGCEVDGDSDGHAIDAYLSKWSTKQLVAHYFSSPQANSPIANVGLATPGVGLIPPNSPLGSTGITGAPWDQHGAGNSANTSDTNPLGVFYTAVPGLGRLGCQPSGPGTPQWNCPNGQSPTGYPSFTAGYNEITLNATNGTAYPPSGQCPGSTLGTFCQYRMAHNWGTGSVQDFSGQNEEGSISRDGTFLAWATDVMGTRGSVSPDWVQGGNPGYAPGAIINPLTNNPNHSSFQNLTGVQFSGAAEPNWAVSCPISQETCTEPGNSTHVWTNVSQAATGSTGQLPCNGLRGDLVPTGEAQIYLNTRIYPVNNNTNNDIFQATSFVSPATGWPVTESSTIPNWNQSCSQFGNTCTDDSGIVWTNIGANDCRNDVVLVDLLSAN